MTSTDTNTTTTTTTTCPTCCSFRYVIDQGGAEKPCPDCKPLVITITGLSHGLGRTGEQYWLAANYTPTTITFIGPARAILHNVAQVRREAEAEARLAGVKGRNSITSGPLAIERKVREAIG